MGAWWWRGVVYATSTLYGAAARAASASPTFCFSGSPMNKPDSVPFALAAASEMIGALLFISDANQTLRVLRLLLSLCEHKGDRLAVPVDTVVLHNRQIVGTRGLGLAHERRRPIEFRGVAMRHHQDDARRRLGRCGVDFGDPAARNSRVFEGRVGQLLHREFGAKLRLARNLQRAVNSGDRRADQAVLMMHERVRMTARN